MCNLTFLYGHTEYRIWRAQIVFQLSQHFSICKGHNLNGNTGCPLRTDQIDGKQVNERTHVCTETFRILAEISDNDEPAYARVSMKLEKSDRKQTFWRPLREPSRAIDKRLPLLYS